MIIDYLKESLTTESQEVSKDVRWKIPNQHKVKHISKFSFGDKLVYDRFSGEPLNQKKGYIARYHRCRKDGNKQKLYTYNPKSEVYDDTECKIVPKSVVSESYEYCDTLGLATSKSVAHALFESGYTYRETINTQDHNRERTVRGINNLIQEVNSTL